MNEPKDYHRRGFPEGWRSRPLYDRVFSCSRGLPHPVTIMLERDGARWLVRSFGVYRHVDTVEEAIALAEKCREAKGGEWRT